MSGPTRILLADDHELVRAGLRMVLDLEPDLQVVAEAGDGAEAIRVALREDLDLAVLDLTMPLLTGLHATRQLRGHRPGLKVIVLSMHDNEQYVAEAVAVGASGYVLKSSADRDLVGAIRSVMRGDPFVYPPTLRAEVRERLRHGPPDGDPDPLTARETEVVKLVAEGHSSKDIGDLLHISERTVERHRANVLEKLDLPDRVALTRYAIRRGLIEP